MQVDHSDTIYDIAIIGGGITGAGVARDASLRGLSVVLLEKNFCGSGTSGKSSKLIHGGIRYLELVWNALKKRKFSEALKNLRFVSLSLKECRILRKIAPDLVVPLSLLIPIYKNAPRKRLSVFLGSTVYFLLSLLSGGGRRPKVFWRKQSVLQRVPELESQGLLGGVLIWDYVTKDLELVRETITAAARHGAQCIERAEVTSFTYDRVEKLYVVSAQIANSGAHQFVAKKLVNAAGPWIDKIRAAHGEKDRYLIPVAGSHIELPKFLNQSVILQAKDGRVFFVINIADKSRVGTTEWNCTDPDAVRVPENDVEYLLTSLSKYFPGRAFKREDVLNVDAGIRPLSASSAASEPNAISRDHEIRIDREGVLHIIGVKLTDHRRAGENVVDCLLPDLERTGVKQKSLSAVTSLDH